MIRLEVRLLPTRQLIGYLVTEFHGKDNDDGSVTGEGWTARFINGAPIQLGPNTRVPVLFIEVQGDREAEAAAFLQRMTMRGGG